MGDKRGGNSLGLNQGSDGFSSPPLLFGEERKKTAKNILEKLKSEEGEIQFKGLEENEICNRKLKPVFAEGRSEIAETIDLEKDEISTIVDEEIKRLLNLSNHQGRDNLYNEKKEKIVDTIDAFIKQQGGIPIYTRKLDSGELENDEELKEEQKYYHIIAWTQLLLKEEKTPLRIDNPFQIVYPAEPDYPIHFANENLNGKTYKEIIEDLLVENIDDIIPLFQAIAEEMLEILKQGNILEISNHSSWFNAPFIATMLINYCRAHPEQIFIILGPALVTGEFGRAGPIKVANLIKTWPQTLNWAKIGRLKKLEKIVKKSFLDNVIKYFLKNAIGNILLMFPSGTTDSFDEETGKIQLAPFSEGTQKLIKMILKNPQNFLHIIAVNDRKTMPTPTQFIRENVYVKMIEEFLNSLTPDGIEKILQKLPEYVVGEDGEPVGTWLKKDTEHT